jgi:hypothetical protein
MAILGALGTFTFGATSAYASTPETSDTGVFALVIGREYRPWLDPSQASAANLPIVDFMVARTTDASNATSPLPVGSLTKTRFYYGALEYVYGPHAFTAEESDNIFTSVNHGFSDGDEVELSDLVTMTGFDVVTTYYIINATADTFQLALTYGGAAINVTVDGSGNAMRLPVAFNPLWLYPVSVVLAATPWWRWGAGNRFANGALTPDAGSLYGFANDLYNPHDVWTPAIGLKGEGTAVIGMQLQPTDLLNMPFPDYAGRWFFHYSERGNVPQNETITDIAGGPSNPYMLVSHQGRLVFPDRRRSAPHISSLGATLDYGSVDDLLFYSNYALPTQDFVSPPLTSDKGEANAAYGPYPTTTQEPYFSMLVAEDSPSAFGTVGVVTIDQLLLVKHTGGGSLVAGDLDNPTHQRLPYIEPTGGLVHKGCHTPIGFVYGSPNGIFSWQGGDATQRISPQLDGFFWDHTDGSADESYAGSRGRMAYWNGYIFVPNNYIFDIETQSWWRAAVPTLTPGDQSAPYNCFDVSPDGILYGFPYRHAPPAGLSHISFPAGPTGNRLSTPDTADLSAPDELDIRFCVDAAGSGTSDRGIAGQWLTTGNQLSYGLFLNNSDQMMFMTSTTGAIGSVIIATCDVAFTGVNTPMLGRVTWRASDGRVQFYSKAPGDVTAGLRSATGWTQLGTNEVAAAATLFDSTADFTVGNTSEGVQYDGNLYGLVVATVIDGAPVFELLPADIPDDPSELTFTTTSGHEVTLEQDDPEATLVYADPTVSPVWHTFDPNELADSYTWQSHPLVETRDRLFSVQNVELTATTATTAGLAPWIEVTLDGYTQAGAPVASVTTRLTLALSDEPQLLRRDVRTNFNAMYVTIRIRASDPNGNPAPKIHRIGVGRRDRQRAPRHGA